MSTMTRREFARTSVAIGVGTALGSVRVLGANDRINLGVIGCGGRGSQDLATFLKHSDINVTAVCDVYDPFRERAVKTVAAANAAANGTPATLKDFRQL